MVAIREFSKKFVAFVAIVAVVSLAVETNAAAINVRLGSGNPTAYVGTGAAPDSGTNWNHVNISSGTTSALSDSAGGGTAVTLTISGGPSPYNVGLTPAVPFPTGYANLFQSQYYIGGNATATILINNLNPTSTYNLYAYEVRGTDNENTTFSVVHDGAPQAPQTSGLDSSGTTALTAVEDYVLFSGLVPTFNGSIYQLQLDFTGFAENTSFGAINGLQLVEIAEVPEPAAAFLLLGGIGSILMLRRRFGARLASLAS